MRADYVPDYRHCLLPYVQWFQDDFLGGIRGMKAQEIGIYTVLLNEMYNRGVALDQSEERLARMCGADIRVFKKVLNDLLEEGKIVRLDCGLWNVRCENAFTSRAEMLKKQSEAGKTSAKKRRKNSGEVEHPLDGRSTDVQPISEAQILIEEPNGSLSETSSDEKPKSKKRFSYPEQFETFWKAYPTHKGMGKKEAHDAWKKLCLDDRAACLAAIPGYRSLLKEKPNLEVQHACRFISKRRFESFAPAEPQALKMVGEEDWRKRLGYGRRESKWLTAQWGPAPGLPGCMVPANLLEPNDGVDWRDRELAA
ncbi:DUF1376 domain-containing protein [Rhizobium sp. AP16]|uniref:YdaU family protein n=1 Tax=Rhizobium sp. AP16 TaxID=1144306 RepID=UPI00026ED25D|nr:DUF1376 domain-containing protein [Rhizobium sp. AP16]EJK83554.1 hypothetical protein PMI03_03209 [Rhizobium sp. AP16]